MFEKGDAVRLNPSIEDFAFGRAGVSYEETGKVTSNNGDIVQVHWPDSYGGNWCGKERELIPASMDNI